MSSLQSVCILGRQPALGLAELESLFGADKLTQLGKEAVLLDMEPGDVTFDRLGGTVKLAKLLTIVDSTDWGSIEKYLSSTVAPHTDYLEPGKMSLGLSVYGINLNPARINATALSLKKVIRDHGRSIRVVPNKNQALSSAQVLHNDLTGPRGWELLIIAHLGKTYIAQTTLIQDIEAYAARDQNRPKRDARVGMLPPKLAQIIINLAGTHVPPPSSFIDPEHPVNKQPQRAKLLDPFCGTAVLLQEALLMGYEILGTDLEPRMIEYSETNLKWVIEKFGIENADYYLQVGDATKMTWDKPFDLIAAETYLGRPFSAEPKPEILSEVMSDVDTIHRKFLRNIADQLHSGFKMAIAVPAWKTKNGFKHLKMLDSLEELGYTRMSFAHVASEELIYHRPEQIVARELVVLIRK